MVKRVLLVDDEESFLISASDGLSFFSDKFEVLTARNGKEAVQVLGSNEIHLVVTDIRMPKMDGFELLIFINNNYPTIPVIVMTAFGTPDMVYALETLGVMQYVEKPFDYDELANKIFEGLEIANQGFEQGIISLPSFLNLIEQERKTCTLRVREGKKDGYFYFLEGELIEIETGTCRGIEAALRILEWADPMITIVNYCRKKRQKTIFSPISEIISAHKKKRGDKKIPIKRENRLKVKKMNQVIENMRSDLGTALIATDFWGIANGQSIGGYNTNPKSVALFKHVNKCIGDCLHGSQFPKLGRYFLMDLEGGIIAGVLLLGEFRCGVLIDGEKSSLELIMNVAFPKFLKGFREAVALED
jgi:CheY-like chemotaxis protein